MTKLLSFLSLASKVWRALPPNQQATVRDLLDGLQSRQHVNVRDAVVRELRYIVEERFQRAAFDERMKRELPPKPGPN